MEQINNTTTTAGQDYIKGKYLLQWIGHFDGTQPSYIRWAEDCDRVQNSKNPFPIAGTQMQSLPRVLMFTISSKMIRPIFIQ